MKRTNSDERRARNRVTAKLSRERRAAYVKKMEQELRAANAKIAELHRLMAEMQTTHDETNRLNQERIVRLENDLLAVHVVDTLLH